MTRRAINSAYPEITLEPKFSMYDYLGFAERDGRTIGELAGQRDNNFDFLRLLLAELVIVSHSYALSQAFRGTGGRLEPLQLVTGGQRTLGEVAVDGFFI